VNCAELQDLAAELALGTVSGAERAAALDHLAGCPGCRALVDQLARAADTMLLLAPVAEPPPGFESKVLARMGVAAPRAPRAHRPPRLRRALVGVAAVALVAALSAAGAAWLGDDADRPTELRTALISDDKGVWTCRAVVYGRDPTWLVVSLDRTDGLNASFSVEAVAAGNQVPVPVGRFTIQDGHGSMASTVELPAEDLESVRVLDGNGRVRYEVTFPAG
jgi:hypothetical protein